MLYSVLISMTQLPVIRRFPVEFVTCDTVDWKMTSTNTAAHTRIFLLSHMRAMTSLAGHILGSHPDINGYYEMHISYEEEDALSRQLEDYLAADELKKDSRYLFDKLLHNDYLLNLDLHVLSECKILVSIQRPEQTIKSIIDLFARKESKELYASPEAATAYYMQRVQQIADFCQSHKQHYYYDAEMFQLDPETLLPAMSDWLGLSQPLSEHYQIFSQTGKARKGDSSSDIKSGRINRVPKDYSHVNIDSSLLAEAEDAYQSCRRKMIESAIASVVMPAE